MVLAEGSVSVTKILPNCIMLNKVTTGLNILSKGESESAKENNEKLRTYKKKHAQAKTIKKHYSKS